VAQSDAVRSRLGWQPRFDDLSTIVGDALAWERELLTRKLKETAKPGERAGDIAAAGGGSRSRA
jgi:hypothetical protein